MRAWYDFRMAAAWWTFGPLGPLSCVSAAGAGDGWAEDPRNFVGSEFAAHSRSATSGSIFLSPFSSGIVEIRPRLMAFDTASGETPRCLAYCLMLISAIG